MYTSIYAELEYILRLVLAAICGAVIGLEREKRQKSAGLRTHIMVAVASSLMMLVSKYGFFDVIGIDGLDADVSRIAAGVVSAIGFIGGGVIFIKRDNLVGLTTAAGLWATVGVGIAIGAGMYVIGIFTTVFMIAIQVMMHWKRFKTVSSIAGNLTVNITKNNLSLDELREKLDDIGIYLRNTAVSRNQDGELILKASIVFAKKDSLSDIVEQMKRNELIDIIDVYALN